SPALRPELRWPHFVAIAPVFVVFLFAQRALVTGMLAGATKG
ncbi:MAG: carbohydrate ABC transporter permease, partial [Acidimicrobiales bacterium]